VQEQEIGTILWRGKWLMAISVAVCVAPAIPTRADLAAYRRAARTLIGRGRPAGGKLTERERLDLVVAVEPVVVGD
jgi:hypothetical protein